jgi:2-C-methyl-D-erythritol 4-phosphate cytidylyltransferase
MTALILLAGGKGERMRSAIPKVFLPLDSKPIALHSYDTLSHLVDQIVVVCPKEYRHLFPNTAHFANPGSRRQDSLANGFSALTPCKRVLIHDAARPYITKEATLLLLADNSPASALATPVVNTIKETDENNVVTKTLKRETLWSVQTPQLLNYDLLKEALTTITHNVTDDVSLAEALGIPVKLILGDPTNTKITHPTDLLCAIS